MKHFYFLVCLLLLQISVQAQKLSDKAEISILTCDPGEELYSTFGHNAVRVRDSVLNIDWVYNYGTFDFNTPNFYIKFGRGQLNYMLSLSYFSHFMEEYINDNRSVREQVLNLTAEQKQKVASFLENNHRPENKFYHYDFFFDNCATRIRDVLKSSLGDSLVFEKQDSTYKETFRDLIDMYWKRTPWTQFGTNLLLGTPTDKKVNAMTVMFIPDFMEVAIDKATLISNGKKVPLVKQKNQIFQSSVALSDYTGIFRPTNVFIALFVLVSLISLIEFRRKRIFKAVDFLLFMTFGLLGLFLFFLWFFTDHKATINNMNLIWAFPLHFFFAIFLLKNKPLALWKYYSLIVAVLTFLALIISHWIPQRFEPSVYPIFLIIIVRCGNYYLVKRNELRVMS